MVSTNTEPIKTPKAEQTKAAILQAALDLFRERGYEETTMRAVAERAGVALGSAYYYFASKEYLIQAFYSQQHQELIAATAEELHRRRTLKSRITAVLNKVVEVSEPYHRFAGVLFKTSADPESPLNPFSAESSQVRSDSIALWSEVVRESSGRIPSDLREQLPYLLWLYHLGIVLFWIHDRSSGRRRTHGLIENTAEIVSKLVSLASNPLLRPLRKAVLKIFVELRSDKEGSPA